VSLPILERRADVQHNRIAPSDSPLQLLAGHGLKLLPLREVRLDQAVDVCQLAFSSLT